MERKNNSIFKEIEEVVSILELEEIPAKRRELLVPLAEFMQAKVNAGEEILLTFICTHNSRRSHLAQVWAQTLAAYFGIPRFQSYSAGTEATALYPEIAETFAKAGFQVQCLCKGENPVYSIKYGRNAHSVIGFSKTLNHGFNPVSDFAAVMTCTQADEGCPFVPGAKTRISIPYEDPKAFDNTSLQAVKYEERSRQIAAELYYIFSKLTLDNGKE